MVCAPVRSIIPSLKLGDYLSVQAHNPCSISHLKRTYFDDMLKSGTVLLNTATRPFQISHPLNFVGEVTSTKIFNGSK